MSAERSRDRKVQKRHKRTGHGRAGNGMARVDRYVSDRLAEQDRSHEDAEVVYRMIGVHLAKQGYSAEFIREFYTALEAGMQADPDELFGLTVIHDLVTQKAYRGYLMVPPKYTENNFIMILSSEDENVYFVSDTIQGVRSLPRDVILGKKSRSMLSIFCAVRGSLKDRKSTHVEDYTYGDRS